MVTSPGGTTIAAIRELEQAGVRAAFLNAIQAAMDRSRELARGERTLNDVEIRVVEDPARRGGRLADRARRRAAATSPSPAARRRAPPTSWPRSSIPTGAGRTSGSATSGRCRPATACSNYRLVRTTLLDSLSRSPEVHRVRGERPRRGGGRALRRGARRRHSRPGAERDRAGRAHGLALPRLAGARRAEAPRGRGRGRARAVRPARDDDAHGLRRDGACSSTSSPARRRRRP